MPAELSVIVPTLNAGPELPACFEALMEGLPAGLIREVIVCDGGSSDATCRIAEAVGAHVITSQPSRGGQLRQGIAIARGAWLLVLHADTVLDPGWARVVGDHVATAHGPAHFRLAFSVSGPGPAWVAGWANLRSAIFKLPFGDQGLLVSRADYDRAGGYPDQPLMEDIALMRALKALPNARLTALPVRAVTRADRYARKGWLRAGAGNLWRQARFLAGTDPHQLAQGYKS